VRACAAWLASSPPKGGAKDVDPAVLSDHLTLLFEGVYATVPALGARAKLCSGTIPNKGNSHG
jgi:hypothetical protein